MEYTIIVNGRSYDLPKKTMAVVEKMDEVLKIDSVKGLSVKQKFEKLHGFVKGLAGEEQAAEMFGSADLAEIDLSELTLAVKKIVDAYDKPISDYDAEKSLQRLNQLPIDKILSMTKAAQSMANAQALQK